MRTRTVVMALVLVAVIAALAVVLIPRLAQQTAPQAYWPTEGWRTSTPEEQGFDSGKLAEMLQALHTTVPGLHSLLIIRNGDVVLDAYFYPYDNGLPHKLASVTKSFMTTLIGIAADQGKLQLDQPMISFFPDRTIANLDARKERITVRHLAGMMNGYQSGCLAGDEPTLNLMRSQPDWIQAALDREMVAEPGTVNCYDSPGMHLLSAILQKATGMTAVDFGRQYLFEPLGIHDVYWEPDPQGYSHGWGDLYLTPRDAAKIGYLWLNHGMWEGKQIVSAAWVEDAVTAHSDGGSDDYGYGWWVSDEDYYAMGRGGQNIKVHPAFNAIVVTTGSSFDYDRLTPMLAAAMVDSGKPLPANPAAVAALNALVPVLAQPPDAPPAGRLPDMAGVISGKVYVLEPNDDAVASLKFEFTGDAEAALYVNIQSKDEVWQIGLDGKYRRSADGSGCRGYWVDAQTFVLERFRDGVSIRRLRFEGDRVEVGSPGSSRVMYTGQAGIP